MYLPIGSAYITIVSAAKIDRDLNAPARRMPKRAEECGYRVKYLCNFSLTRIWIFDVWIVGAILYSLHPGL